MTQAATTGPARQPRPTSSVPAIARKPESRRRRSTADISAIRANSAKRFVTSRSAGFGVAFALFFDAGCFTAESPEVIEFRAADPAMAFNLDVIDAGRVQGEHALHADSAGDFADGEHLPRAAAFARDHQTLKNLNALFVAFFDLHVDFDRVSRSEVRDVGPRLTRFDEFHEILSHFDNLPVFLKRARKDRRFVSVNQQPRLERQSVRRHSSRIRFRIAGSSPPETTKSPIEISSGCKASRIRSSNPS